VSETFQCQSDRCAGNVEADSQRMFGNAFARSEFSRQDQFSQTQDRAACLGFGVCGQTRSVSIDGFRCAQSNTLQSDLLIYHTLLWARALCPRSITKTNPLFELERGYKARAYILQHERCWHAEHLGRIKSACQNIVDTGLTAQYPPE